MSVEYDLHLYGSPPEGMDSNVYWSHPKWWMPLSHKSKGSDGGSPPPDNGQNSPSPASLPSPLPSPQRAGQGFLTTLMNIFHRHDDAHKRNSSTSAGEEDNSNEDTAGVDGNGNQQSTAAHNKGDLESALAALFNEESLRICDDEKEGEGEERADGDGDQGVCPLAHLADLSCDLFGDADCSVLRAGGGSDDDDDRKRKVKFADDEGLPLTAVLVFEVTADTDEEEEDGEGGEGGEEGEGGKNLKKRPTCFRLTKSNKRRLLTLYNAKRAAAATARAAEKCPAYRRYYKPYKEDYESHRMQAAGAFSMVGF